MSLSQPIRSVLVDFSPDDESISLYQVKRVEVENVIAHALKYPVFFDEVAARGDHGYLLDDEFARRIGAGILNALALSYPELKAIINTTNEPIPRTPTASPSPD
ncbi:hypothetical protein [Caballeronia sp. KNU42]|jgi:hypothetical protein